MRLGKTLPVVRAMQTRVDANKILIVCTQSAMRGWIKEIVLEEAGEYVMLLGDRATRLGLLNSIDARWYIINPEGYSVLPEIKFYPWDAVIIDESRFISEPKSHVSKFYAKNFRAVKYRGVMGGTPAPESDLEYFTQLEFADKKWFGFNNFYEFKEKLFMVRNFEDVPTEQGRKYIEMVLAENCLLMDRKEVGLGEIRKYETRYCTLSESAKEVYDTLRDSFILETDHIIDSTIYAPTAYSWMRRLFGGSIDGKIIHHHKIELLKNLLFEIKEPAVIVCHFVDEVNYLGKYLAQWFKVHHAHGKYPKDRNKFADDFQNGVFDYAIIQPECFTHSIDLSRAKYMIFYSSPEGAETREQVEERIVNIFENKKPVVNYIDLLCDDTIESEIVDSLIRKETRQKRMERIVKKMQVENVA